MNNGDSHHDSLACGSRLLIAGNGQLHRRSPFWATLARTGAVVAASFSLMALSPLSDAWGAEAVAPSGDAIQLGQGREAEESGVIHGGDASPTDAASVQDGEDGKRTGSPSGSSLLLPGESSSGPSAASPGEVSSGAGVGESASGSAEGASYSTEASSASGLSEVSGRSGEFSSDVGGGTALDLSVPASAVQPSDASPATAAAQGAVGQSSSADGGDNGKGDGGQGTGAAPSPAADDADAKAKKRPKHVGFVTARTSHRQISNGSWRLRTTKSHGRKTLAEGRARDVSDQYASATAVLFGSRYFLLFGAFRYNAFRGEYVPTSTTSRFDGDDYGFFHSGLSQNYTANLRGMSFFKIDGRLAVIHASLRFDWTEYGYVGASGMAVGTWNIIDEENLKVGIGLIGFAGAHVSWPVYPIATLNYRWSENWAVEIMPPMMHLVWTIQDQKTRWEIGVGMNGEREYLRAADPEGGYRNRFISYFQMNPEVVFQHSFHPRFTMSLSAGVYMQTTARIYSQSSGSRLAEVFFPTRAFVQGGLTLKI